MGLIGNLFRKAQDLDFQDRRIVILESDLARANLELGLAKKAIDTARNSENKTLRRHADMMSQKAGLTPTFVKDAEPKKGLAPDPDGEERIHSIATIQRQADIDDGLEPEPIEFYVGKLRDNPDPFI